MVYLSMMKATVAAAVFLVAATATEDMYPTEEEFLQLKLLNDLRAKGHACFGKTYPPNPVPLTWNCALWRASRAHSHDMATNDYFSHTGLDGSHPSERAARYGATFSNENIASGYDDAMRSFQQWVDSGLGHCTGMMEPEHKSMAAGHSVYYASSYWHYWTQTMSRDEPDPDTQDCLNGDGVIPVPAPTPPPTYLPTLPAISATVDQMMDFEPSTYEMALLAAVNRKRYAGTRNECHGDYYYPGDLEPLVWNCPLFKVGRHHMHDNLMHDTFDRTGSDGKTFKERCADYNVPFTCISFKLKEDDESGYWSSPDRMADRLASLACWAVYGPEYKSLAGIFAQKVDDGSKFPSYAWYVFFDRFTPEATQQSCYGGLEPVIPPTPFPSDVPQPTPEPTDEPTAAPTDAPTGTPSAVPTDPPSAVPTEPPADCVSIEAKKDCKKEFHCAWKKNCKEKAKVCPKQKTAEKCAKLGCTGWDSEASSCIWQ